ncbi:transglycosylase SLT domain-containing protein [Swingsia samuiensis]|uniref:Transglycosylase SLT domain-containing protein n=1 Tax=Swingsia samuiensis TaxID=1293412 RepID=A0A4Y6ULC9_9PROT|nr:hypothetical protein [Swingsia samuiensis]QDH17874.1 hypothetical protein E3D00_10050 [Swingsia samuiensis]
MNYLKKTFVFPLLFFILSACVSSPPQHPDNICSIFQEKRHWYHVALKTEKKWHVPFSIPMAMMYQESGFHSNLHTKRTYFLGFIPWGYITTAYGYPQAKTDIWHEYEHVTHQRSSRENFADSLDFMDWYITISHQQNNIAVQDAMQQYLAYHEGWGGFRRKTYLHKPWLVNVAQKVSIRSSRYSHQYARCEESLKDKSFWSWLF